MTTIYNLLYLLLQSATCCRKWVPAKCGWVMMSKRLKSMYTWHWVFDSVVTMILMSYYSCDVTPSIIVIAGWVSADEHDDAWCLACRTIMPWMGLACTSTTSSVWTGQEPIWKQLKTFNIIQHLICMLLYVSVHVQVLLDLYAFAWRARCFEAEQLRWTTSCSHSPKLPTFQFFTGLINNTLVPLLMWRVSTTWENQRKLKWFENVTEQVEECRPVPSRRGERKFYCNTVAYWIKTFSCSIRLPIS